MASLLYTHHPCCDHMNRPRHLVQWLSSPSFEQFLCLVTKKKLVLKRRGEIQWTTPCHHHHHPTPLFDLLLPRLLNVPLVDLILPRLLNLSFSSSFGSSSSGSSVFLSWIFLLSHLLHLPSFSPSIFLLLIFFFRVLWIFFFLVFYIFLLSCLLNFPLVDILLPSLLNLPLVDILFLRCVCKIEMSSFNQISRYAVELSLSSIRLNIQ